MDITRLPVATWSRPANNPIKTATQPVSAAVEVNQTVVSHKRGRVETERVIQGELLVHNRHSYLSTQSFLNERNLDQARPVEHERLSEYTNRGAISRYLNHARPEPVAEPAQGSAVDFFV